MLDFTLNEEQTMLVEAIHRLAAERMRPVFRDADETGTIPAGVIQAGWNIGILPSAIPEEFGGFGDQYSAVTGVVAAEELAWGDLAIAANILAPGAVAIPVLLAGTAEQKESILPGCCDMQLPPLAAALTEPRIQYDPRHLATTAVRVRDDYLLNGAKSLVPLADTADVYLVYAQEEGQTQAFFVPADTPGLTVGQRDRLMGLKALPTFGITLVDCRIPAGNRLGGAEGIDIELILNHGRVTMGALAVGLVRAGYQYAREYAKQRVQFGEPIAHRQSIAFMLAEMAIEVDAARMMVWEAAWLLDQGRDTTTEVAVLKHYIDDMAVRVADQALQTLGGYGYMREYPVELWLRNARGFASFDCLAIA